jgi:hypothetical protein
VATNPVCLAGHASPFGQLSPNGILANHEAARDEDDLPEPDMIYSLKAGGMIERMADLLPMHSCV